MSSNIRLQRICQHCGTEFTAKTTVTKYCGDKCAKRAYKARKKAEKLNQSNKETLEIKRKPVEMIKAKEFLTAQDAATLLGFSIRTVYRLIDKGTLHAVNLGDRLTRIKRSNLYQLLEQPQPTPIPAVELNIKDCYYMGEIQEKFNITEKTLYNLLERENIPKVQKGKYCYVPKKPIEQLLS